MDIEINHLRKTYGSAVAVADLSVKVPQGRMLALLGPSGCGKTTTLRMVAGFIEPTSGSIRAGGSDITRMPAHRRDTGLVFQNYALFPHMSAAENIAFGLRRRGVGRAERDQRVGVMLDKLKLSGLADRLPRQLSGNRFIRACRRAPYGERLPFHPYVAVALGGERRLYTLCHPVQYLACACCLHWKGIRCHRLRDALRGCTGSCRKQSAQGNRQYRKSIDECMFHVRRSPGLGN